MKKKILLFAIALFLMVLCFAACNAEEPPSQTACEKNGHTEVVDPAVVATCTTPGKTYGKHCSVCNAVLVKQETVAALGHTEVTDAAVAPTCTETGLTEGKHCSVCNAVLVKQTVVEATGHQYTTTVIAPTETKSGYTAYTCTVCGDTYKDNYTQPTRSLGLAYTVNEDGKTCTVTGIGTCTDTEIFIASINPEGYEVTSIGDDAFDGCSSLTSITFGENSQLTSIGYEAFYGCSRLTSITIPASVTSITFGGTVAQWNAISKGSDWNFETGAYTIICTDGVINK